MQAIVYFMVFSNKLNDVVTYYLTNVYTEIFSYPCKFLPNLDYNNYPLPKELAPNGIHFGAKCSGKVQLQAKLGSD